MGVDIKIINDKLDIIIRLLTENKEEWKDSKSAGRFIKTWAGFYIGDLLADETIKRFNNAK